MTATDGPLAGTTQSGAFIFNSSIVPIGGGNGEGTLIQSLTFSWNGITYNSSSANTGVLGFDVHGRLNNFLIGNNCPQTNTCNILTNSNQWTITPGFGFSYASPTVPDIYKGTVTYSVPPVIDGRRDVNQDAMPDLIWENDTTRQIVAWSMGGAQGNNLLGWSYLSPETSQGGMQSLQQTSMVAAPPT